MPAVPSIVHELPRSNTDSVGARALINELLSRAYDTDFVRLHSRADVEKARPIVFVRSMDDSMGPRSLALSDSSWLDTILERRSFDTTAFELAQGSQSSMPSTASASELVQLNAKTAKSGRVPGKEFGAANFDSQAGEQLKTAAAAQPEAQSQVEQKQKTQQDAFGGRVPTAPQMMLAARRLQGQYGDKTLVMLPRFWHEVGSVAATIVCNKSDIACTLMDVARTKYQASRGQA